MLLVCKEKIVSISYKEREIVKKENHEGGGGENRLFEVVVLKGCNYEWKRNKE